MNMTTQKMMMIMWVPPPACSPLSTSHCLTSLRRACEICHLAVEGAREGGPDVARGVEQRRRHDAHGDGGRGEDHGYGQQLRLSARVGLGGPARNRPDAAPGEARQLDLVASHPHD